MQRLLGKVTRDTEIDLRAHEAAGGHTVARHVGKSAEFISQRTIEQALDAASTFSGMESATEVANEGVRANASDINTIVWGPAGGAANRAFTYDAGRNIGQYLGYGNVVDKKGRERKPKALKSDAQSATVVVHMQWAPAPPHSWYLLTCYPNPPR